MSLCFLWSRKQKNKEKWVSNNRVLISKLCIACQLFTKHQCVVRFLIPSSFMCCSYTQSTKPRVEVKLILKLPWYKVIYSRLLNFSAQRLCWIVLKSRIKRLHCLQLFHKKFSDTVFPGLKCKCPRIISLKETIGNINNNQSSQFIFDLRSTNLKKKLKFKQNWQTSKCLNQEIYLNFD